MTKIPLVGPGSNLEMYGSDDEESQTSSSAIPEDEPQQNPSADSHAQQNTGAHQNAGAQNAGAPLTTLPTELKNMIADRLPAEDLLHLSRVSKSLRSALSAKAKEDISTIRELRTDSDLARVPFQERPAKLDNVLNKLPQLHPADQSRIAARLSHNLKTAPIPQQSDQLKKNLWSQVVKMPVDAHVLEATQNLDLFWFQPPERAARLNEILDVHQAGIDQGLMPRTYDSPLGHAAYQVTKLPKADQEAGRERIRSLLSANGMNPATYDLMMLT
jgi:hypothetical protein